jgi:hypothetical protein
MCFLILRSRREGEPDCLLWQRPSAVCSLEKVPQDVKDDALRQLAANRAGYRGALKVSIRSEKVAETRYRYVIFSGFM